MKSVNKIGNISIEVAGILDFNISDIETIIEVDTVEEYKAIMEQKHEQTKEILAEVKVIADKIVGAVEVEEEDEMDIPEFLKQGKHPLEAIFGSLGDDEQQPSHPLEGLLKQLQEGPAKIHPGQGGPQGIPLGAILGGLGITPKGVSLSDLIQQIKDEQEGKDDGFNPFGGKSPFSF